VTERQRSLIDDLNLIENPQERLSILVDRTRNLPRLPAEARVESNLVPGCISQVWLVGTRDAAGRCHFRCDADGPLVKALVAFLCDYYSDCTPAEILAEFRFDESNSLDRRDEVRRTALAERVCTPLAAKASALVAAEPLSGIECPQNKRVEDSPLAALGLLQTLSPTRRNGLAQVRARIHAFAQTQPTTHA